VSQVGSKGDSDGPRYIGINLSLSKNFHLRKRDKFQSREVFNALGQANFSQPVLFVNSPTGGASAGAYGFNATGVALPVLKFHRAQEMASAEQQDESRNNQSLSRKPQ